MASFRMPDTMAWCQIRIDDSGIAATTAIAQGKKSASRTAGRIRANVSRQISGNPSYFTVRPFSVALYRQFADKIV
jgi:hypothetical protein